MSYSNLNMRNNAIPQRAASSTPAATAPPVAARTVLQGNEVSKTPPANYKGKPVAVMRGESGSFTLTDDMLSRGMIIIGSTGVGKTTVYKMLLDRVVPGMGNDDVMLIFDSKGDFLERYYEPGNPAHVVISAKSEHAHLARGWNVFGELFNRSGVLDESSEMMAKEIAKALFKGMESQSQPFFNTAAADITAMVLVAFCREAKATGDYSKLNNQEFIRFMKKATTDDLYALAGKYPDFGYIKSYLGEPGKTTSQSLGVFGYLHGMIGSNFVGPFSGKGNGQFSIRRLMREKGKKIIFMEYDLLLSKTLDSMNSLLFDLAAREALDVGGGSTYMVVDEMHLLPHSEQFSTLTNYGRSKGVKTIVGLQAITQLYENYGENGGKNIAAGFINAICFSAVDEDTRAYVSGRFGRAFTSQLFGGINIQREGHTVEDSDIRNLRVGEAYIDLPEQPPFKFRFENVV